MDCAKQTIAKIFKGVFGLREEEFKERFNWTNHLVHCNYPPLECVFDVQKSLSTQMGGKRHVPLKT